MKLDNYEKLSRSELIARLQLLESARAAIDPARDKELNSPQKRVQAAISDREEWLRTILECAAEGIVTTDGRGIIESVNVAAEEIFGYQAGEIIGQNASVLSSSPQRDFSKDCLASFRRARHAKTIGLSREVTGRRKDGSIFPMELSISEVKLADRRVFAGFVRDITERKQIEKEILEVTDREQRRIGQDLHDGLCQHLAGIELMSQALVKNLSLKSKSHASQISAIASHVRDAIRHTRVLARGLSPVTIESEGLASALQELATTTEKIYEIQCRFEFEEFAVTLDHATATHLFRIAQEAVSNAIKHGKADRLIISLREARGRVLLRVSDNGGGFLRRSPKNKGMGLRIMQSRAGMIGGTVAIERNRGGGISIVCAVPQSGSLSKSGKNDVGKN